MWDSKDDGSVAGDGGQLKIISWSVRAVAADIEHLLEILSTEIDGDIFFCQELSSSNKD